VAVAALVIGLSPAVADARKAAVTLPEVWAARAPSPPGRASVVRLVRPPLVASWPACTRAGPAPQVQLPGDRPGDARSLLRERLFVLPIFLPSS
jgi:hypothetical protein